MNFDSTQIGVPYVRVPSLHVDFPPPGTALPLCTIEQAEAVLLADGSIRQIGEMPTIQSTLDVTNQTPIPLVDYDTGAPLAPEVCAALGAMVSAGAVNLPMVLLLVLAAVRQQQELALVGGGANA